MTILDDRFGLLLQMTISDACFRWLFRIIVQDDYFGCLFQMTFPDDCSEWLFPIPPNGCFGLLFQMNIPDVCFRWLFRITFRNSTTDSYLSDQFVFPISIPISTNHSTDWSHDWFVLERRLPTAELWPRSSLIFLTEHLRWLLLSKMWLSLQFAVSRESSYVEDFLLLLFQQKKGNILIVFKYLLFSQA